MPQLRRIVVFDTPDLVAHQAATEFEVRARAAIEERDRFAVALSGGKTPRDLFELLASPEFAEDIDWARVHFFWGDERCVPPEDRASNFAQAKTALFDRIDTPPENIHRMRGELEPQAGAADYREQLRAFFGEHVELDLIYLGLGDDGHTASLFPDNESLDVTDTTCAAVHVPSNEIAQWRLTLTYPVINDADAAIFLVEGASKSRIVARVLEGPLDARHLPAQAVAPEHGSLIWLVDAPAAAELKTNA